MFFTTIFEPKKQGFWIVLGQYWNIEDYIIYLSGSSATQIALDDYFSKTMCYFMV